MEKGTTKSPIRRVITLQVKKQVLDAHEKEKSWVKLSKQFGLTDSTIKTIVSNKHKILNALDEGCQAKRSRVYPAKHTELENAIASWLKSARSQNIALSGPLIKGKAKEIAERVHIKNFEASDGWLARLKQRHSISLNSEQSEAGMNLDDIPNKLRKCDSEPSSNGPENVPECSNSRLNFDEICTETNDVMATWRKQLCIKEEPVLEASEDQTLKRLAELRNQKEDEATTAYRAKDQAVKEEMEEDEEFAEERPRVSEIEAYKAMQIVREFVKSNSANPAILKHIDKLDDFINKECMKKKKQQN